MRIGVAGFGKMGSAMAGRLAERGCEVIAWNRDLARVAQAGMDFANSPRALAEACPVVISSLFDEGAVKAVYGGPDGLVEGGTDTLLIEMSTVSPSSQRALANAVSTAGGSFIECPVSGTTGTARAGALLGFAGGAAGDVDRARPVLDLLCRRVVHVGPVGSGSRIKLAVNLPLISFWQSFGEAMAIIRPLNADPEWVVDVFGDTAGAPAVLKIKAADIAAALSGSDVVAPTFDIDSMRKDLRLALAEAAEGAVPLPVAQAVLGSMDEASGAGWGRHDCAWMPAFWARKAGGRPQPPMER